MLPSRQLTSSRLLGPVVTMADYDPLRHPNISDLRRRAALVIKNLEKTASHDPKGGEWALQTPEESSRAAESWRVSLGSLRTLQVELEGGLATARFVREVRRHAKDLAPKLESTIVRAVENIRQLRAFAAVMAGDTDDEQLGIEVIPRPPVEGEAPVGPSVTFDW